MGPTVADILATGADYDQPFAPALVRRSPIRDRIIKESIDAANRQQRHSQPRWSRQTASRKHTWTKRPKYEGFQSTFDSNADMAELRPSRVTQADVPASSSSSGSVLSSYDEYKEGIGPQTAPTTPDQWPDWQNAMFEEIDQILYDVRARRVHLRHQHAVYVASVYDAHTELQSGSTNHSAQDLTTQPLDNDQADPGPRHWGECGSFLSPEQPLSQEDVVSEARDIYDDLMEIEAKCIGTDWKIILDSGLERQSYEEARQVNDQWDACEELFKALLAGHHDFLLASNHPKAPPALRNLATKYAMPSHMWDHGIESFLQLYALPGSREHMISFSSYAESLVALLQRALPTMSGELAEVCAAIGRYKAMLKAHTHQSRRYPTEPSLGPNEDASNKGQAPTSVRTDLTTGSQGQQSIWASLRSCFEEELKHLCFSTTEQSRREREANIAVWLRPSDTILDTILSWLYFGQAFFVEGLNGNQNFDIYCKVFGALGLAAKVGECWSRPLLVGSIR